MDKIQFPYRSYTHLPFLHVVAESGSWDKYGLSVDYDKPISSGEAHDAVTSGAIEFVGGNHVTTYGHVARGHNWVYLGQTVNVVPGRKLVVRPDSGINSIADLRLKKVGVRGSHPTLNDWLQLKQNGLDVDRDEVEIVDKVPGDTNADNDSGRHDSQNTLWQWVRDKHVDAAFLPAPAYLFAQRAGLKIIDIQALPMIYFTTVSTGPKFLNAHPDIAERFLKGLIEGIHFFKTQPEKTMEIMRRRYTDDGEMDDEIARITYKALADALEPNLYPSVAAIDNVYQEGKRKDGEATKINPLALWDLHYIEHLDQTGFVRDLYKEKVAR